MGSLARPQRKFPQSWDPASSHLFPNPRYLEWGVHQGGAHVCAEGIGGREGGRGKLSSCWPRGPVEGYSCPPYLISLCEQWGTGWACKWNSLGFPWGPAARSTLLGFLAGPTLTRHRDAAVTVPPGGHAENVHPPQQRRAAPTCTGAGRCCPNTHPDKHTRLQLQQVTSKNPLDGTGDSTQYSVVTFMGKESKKEWIHVYTCVTEALGCIAET